MSSTSRRMVRAAAAAWCARADADGARVVDAALMVALCICLDDVMNKK
jgi:hypothetical protein